MYLPYWRLARRPFEERVDATWFFPSAHHDALLTQLRCIVRRGDRVVVVSGGRGFGKTMVAQTLADSLPAASYRTLFVPVADRSCAGVLQWLAAELHEGGSTAIQSEPSHDLSQELSKLRAHDPRRVIALLDGADRLSHDELHQLVVSIQSLPLDSCGITTVLIGSPELLLRARALDRAAVAPVPQCVLGAMAPADTIDYVDHRLRLAGGDRSLFSDSAMERIYELSGGVPRVINRLADLSLLIGYSLGSAAVGTSELWAAQQELALLAPTRTATVAPSRRWRTLVAR